MRLGMADGRMFTQYIGAKLQNDNLKQSIGHEMGKKISNYEYRLYLENTGKLYVNTPQKCPDTHGITCYENAALNSHNFH